MNIYEKAEVLAKTCNEEAEVIERILDDENARIDRDTGFLLSLVKLRLNRAVEKFLEINPLDKNSRPLGG